MIEYKTTSKYGYCLNDQKPPPIDTTATYRITRRSSHYDNRPIIIRSDGLSYQGEMTWIVDEFTLVPHQ